MPFYLKKKKLLLLVWGMNRFFQCLNLITFIESNGLGIKEIHDVKDFTCFRRISV